MQAENWIDLTVFIIIFISSVMGAWRGLFSSIFSILALILAVVVTYTQNDFLLTTAHALFGDTSFVSVATTGGTFLVSFLFFGLLGRLLANGLKKADVIGINLGGGGIFGFLRGALLCSLLILLFSATGADKKSTAWQTSQAVPLLGLAIKNVMQMPFMAKYRGWLQFDSQQRPHLVLERSNPTALPQEEKKSAKRLTRKERKKQEALAAQEKNDEDIAHPLPQVNQLKKRKKEYNETLDILSSVVAVPSPMSNANRSRVKDPKPESLAETLAAIRQLFYATSEYSETLAKPCTDDEPCSKDTQK